jgi:hypothetical protein
VTFTASEYEAPYDGWVREEYHGEVSVDRRTFAQGAHAETTFDLSWPGTDVRVTSVMDVDVTGDGLDVAIGTTATLDGEQVSQRTWRERIGRQPS